MIRRRKANLVVSDPGATPTGGEQPHATLFTRVQIARMGTVPDAGIAQQAGCSIESVRRKRAALKIAAHRPAIRWTDGQIDLIAKLPIAQAAAQIGVSQRAVRIERHRTGAAKSRKAI